MRNENLEKALKAYEQEFGFSFSQLLDKPNVYQQKVKEMKSSGYERNLELQRQLDDLQLEIYSR